MHVACIIAFISASAVAFVCVCMVCVVCVAPHSSDHATCMMLSLPPHENPRQHHRSHLEKVLVEVTPYLQKGLAVGRLINTVAFDGHVLGTTDILTQEVTVSKGKLQKRAANEYVIEMVAEVTVALLDGRSVSLVFDEFPMDSILASDIKEVIAEGIGLANNAVYMVREYPTLR